MKKILVMALIAVCVVTVFCGTVLAGVQQGPAPGSGDCNPDGPEWDTHPAEDNIGMGPAPNSGDGIPDGSGF